jgi:hypothetical protein
MRRVTVGIQASGRADLGSNLRWGLELINDDSWWCLKRNSERFFCNPDRNFIANGGGRTL